MSFDDTVSLTIGATTWSGWDRVRIARGIERIPSDFSISLTERFPTSDTALEAEPGKPVTVMIGSDTVLTGYLDRRSSSIDATSHAVEITGRGKCQDLVDCAAEIDQHQLMNINALQAAEILVQQFGLTVSTKATGLPTILQINTMLAETPYAIIERIANYSNLLVYEGTDGNLILGTLGTDQMASGFAEGVNIQSARAILSMDERFSVITVIGTAQNTQWVTEQGVPIQGIAPSNILAQAFDPSVPRYRPHVLPSQQTDSLNMAAQRADWEIGRRYGRSQAVTLVCDSWRASDGKLWQVNTLASLSLPSLKVADANWLITEVAFSRDLSRGTVAEVTLMPPQAFAPEPTILYPFDRQVAQDQAGLPP